MREHESAERIKAVSMKRFNDKGYEATTIREICSQIGITAPSFYYYFDSKEELYLQMIQESSDLHQSALTRAMEECPSQIAEDRLKFVFQALLRFYQEYPEAYTFLLRNTLFPVAAIKEKIRERSNIWKHQFSEQIAGFLASSQQRHLPKMDQTMLIKGFHRFIIGYMLQLVSGITDNKDEMADEAWHHFWHGIR